MEWIGEIDWSRWAGVAWSFGWPVLVAIPGLVAFIWQWRDRRDRDMARKPFVEITPAENIGLREQNGWRPFSVSVRNDADVPICITKLEAIKPDGLMITMPPYPLSPRVSVPVTWQVEPGAKRPLPHERPWVLYLSSCKASIRDVQLVIRCTFKEMSARQRISTTIITSDPIALPQAIRNRTS